MSEWRVSLQELECSQKIKNGGCEGGVLLGVKALQASHSEAEGVSLLNQG